MKKKLLQIRIGKLPTILKPCIDSQIAFAIRDGREIVTLLTVPDEYKDYDVRTASDYMRVEYLAKNPYTAYFDWDVTVPPDFKIKDPEDYEYGLFTDHYLYNGNRTDVFLKVLDIMCIRKDERRYEEGVIYKAFCQYGIDTGKIRKDIQHLNYNRLSKVA